MRIEIRNLNGNQFVIRHWGDASKPKLLMLHGFPEFGDAWEDLAPLVANLFHCIAQVQRG